ncbi:DUF397 domain-containing protein [Streptomyces phaeochromogenes]|uniref:DUF397 domain-containing protein n=1 Tax=Streptomyces phaeochromogenes TaxID=1923 RepID=UPI0033D3D522
MSFADAGSGALWFTSSYSNGAGGECVECARTEDGALVRDSKSVERHVIVVRGQAWQTFVQALRRGALK